MDNKEVGKRIQYIRNKKNLTREEFAEKCNVSITFVNETEKGLKTISGEKLYSICENMDVSADFILFGKENLADMQTPITELLKTIPDKYNQNILEFLEKLDNIIKIASNDEM